jgi:hypothetical protein
MRSRELRHDWHVSPPRIPPSARTIVDHLGDGRPLPAELADLQAWLESSARVRAFMDTNRDKIRKKLRLATTPETRLDLRAELRVASLLLADRRVELEFEAYGSGNRGPDFTATFRGGRPVNLEITRRHAAGTTGLERTIMGKLRQLPPSTANVLVIAADEAPDLLATTRELRGRADRRDDAWFATRGVADATTFNQGWLRLAAVVVWRETPGGATVVSWTNSGARIGLDDPIRLALEAALRG